MIEPKKSRVVFVASDLGVPKILEDKPEVLGIISKYKHSEFTESSLESILEKLEQQRDSETESGAWAKNYYALSKLFLSLHVKVLANLFPDYSFCAITPGFTDTDMTKGMNAPRTPEDAAEHICSLALQELPSGMNGEYFKDGKQVELF